MSENDMDRTSVLLQPTIDEGCCDLRIEFDGKQIKHTIHANNCSSEDMVKVAADLLKETIRSTVQSDAQYRFLFAAIMSDLLSMRGKMFDNTGRRKEPLPQEVFKSASEAEKDALREFFRNKGK